MSSICLCMIVRNEVEFLGRCLASVRDVIGYWVICDTGSTDGTQDLIRRELAGVPGELHQHDWVNFGANRTRSMQLARGKADYLLVVDADTTLEVEPGALDVLSADAYALCHVDEVSYGYRTCLVRGDRHWHYVGAVHPYVASDDPYAVEILDGVRVRAWSVGGVRNRRYEHELVLLERMCEQDPGNPRWVFFLAQTHRDLGHVDAAIEMYDRRVEMGGWDEEVFFAMLQAGVLRAERGDWPAAMAGLVAAWEFRPSRMEPLYELASRLRLRGEFHTAYLFARRGLGQRVPRDVFCVSPWMYEWGLAFEYSVCAYWVGELRGALETCRQLLAMPNLPEDYRRSTMRNMDLCVRKLAKTPALPAASAPRGKQKRRR
jgi:tetratricopeptide (TPR) repeat protein